MRQRPLKTFRYSSLLVILRKEIECCIKDWYTAVATLVGKLGTVPL